MRTTANHHNGSEKVAAALDLGTTKICAIIGKLDQEGQLRVLGMGSHPSKGLRRGIVVDFETTVDSIEQAVSHAEQIANYEVAEVFVGIAGGHMRSHNTEAMIEISNPLRGVDPQDVHRAVQKARGFPLPEDHEIIHCFPQEYYCDDILIERPVGRLCRRLKVKCHIITAAITSAQNLMQCIRMADLRPADILIEAVASAQAVLNENEKDLGVVMIDIGGGTSDVVIYEQGRIRHSACIPMGGDDISYDVHHALKIPRFDAENVKKRMGSALVSRVDAGEMIEVNSVFEQKRIKVERSFLARVIQARCQEILEAVWDNINASPFNVERIGGVVLTGGSSLMEHLPELCAKMYNCTVKVGVPQNIRGMKGIVSSPIYSTGIGLLLHGLGNPQPSLQLAEGGVFRKINTVFRNFVNWYD